MRLAAAALAVATGGCVAIPASAPAPVSDLSLRPAADGLDVVGSDGRQIGFGRAASGALASAARVAGVMPVAVPCGTGREGRQVGGVTMIFARGSFVGWATDGAAAGTPCD